MADPSNKKIMDFAINPDPAGSWTYVVESGTNYRVQLGGNDGIAVLNATGQLPATQGGTGIGSYTANNYIRALNSTTLEQRTPTQVLADIGAGTGSVTSVDIDDATGITFTGGPVTGTGVFTPALSANLQAWSGLATSAKQDASANLAAWSGITTASKLNTASPAFTGTMTGTGDINVSTNDVIATNFRGNTTTAVLGTNSAGTVYIRPNGIASATDQTTFTTATAAVGTNMTVAGTIIATGNITANNSDERLKKEIRTIEDGLDIINQLRGVRYIKDGEDCVGVIAQEVRKIVPEVVVEQTDEMKTLAVSYGNLVAPLIEAVKTLTKRVEYLENIVYSKTPKTGL